MTERASIIGGTIVFLMVIVLSILTALAEPAMSLSTEGDPILGSGMQVLEGWDHSRATVGLNPPLLWRMASSSPD